ncbi:ABC transporter permease [Eubacterium sp. 1001713B170207_170306_E7]|uniref:ABC transporter permease n=1 Tax=Eubacterium sp. 1001713B170207_170306_E7 TaxID=2787097 RepID=UPI0018983B21|nr:ABC transporter permease [Eubacterium sp. 1001713B170207_170306_E7]
MKAYIKAECFRIIKRPGTWRAILIICVLTIPILILSGFSTSYMGPQNGSFIVLSLAGMPIAYGAYLIPVFTNSAITEDHRFHTSKNVLALGLSRTKVYFSKLVSAFITMLGTYSTLYLLLIGISHLIWGISNDSDAYRILLYQLLSGIPVCFGALCVSCAFAYGFKHAASAVLGYLGFLMLPYSLLQLLYRATHFNWIERIYYLLLVTPFHRVLVNDFDPIHNDGPFGVLFIHSNAFQTFPCEIALYCLILGLAYAAAAIPIGLYIFKRKEIY